MAATLLDLSDSYVIAAPPDARVGTIDLQDTYTLASTEQAVATYDLTDTYQLVTPGPQPSVVRWLNGQPVAIVRRRWVDGAWVPPT